MAFRRATHEYIACEYEKTVEDLDCLSIGDHGDGGNKTDKFARDRRLLEAEVREDPGNPRTVFYLAQTYRDLSCGGADTAQLALERYEQRSRMAGWDEETYCARRQVGILRRGLGDWPGAADAFVTAWEGRPSDLRRFTIWRRACSSAASTGQLTGSRSWRPGSGRCRSPAMDCSWNRGYTGGDCSFNTRSPRTGAATTTPRSARAGHCWL